MYIYILWIGLHSHWQRAPQPAKLSSSFSNQRTASKQDCPKWQGFMDMQGSATTRVVWSPRLSARTASSRSSKWLNARYPSLLPWPYGLAWASVFFESETDWKTWRLEGTACLPMIFGGCNDVGFTFLKNPVFLKENIHRCILGDQWLCRSLSTTSSDSGWWPDFWGSPVRHSSDIFQDVKFLSGKKFPLFW